MQSLFQRLFQLIWEHEETRKHEFSDTVYFEVVFLGILSDWLKSETLAVCFLNTIFCSVLWPNRNSRCVYIVHVFLSYNILSSLPLNHDSIFKLDKSVIYSFVIYKLTSWKLFLPLSKILRSLFSLIAPQSRELYLVWAEARYILLPSRIQWLQ